MKAYSAWTTTDELKFIAGLGTHSVHGANSAYRTWVERYRDTMQLRKDWTGIDRAAIRAAVQQVLAKPHPDPE